DGLAALLRPATAAAGEHPRRPGLVVVGPAAHEGGVAVGGERDRHALAGAADRAAADEPVALLRPATAAAGEHPRPLRPPPADDRRVAVGGERDRHALALPQFPRRPRPAAAH